MLSVTRVIPTPRAGQPPAPSSLDELVRHSAPPVQRVLAAVVEAQTRHQLFPANLGHNQPVLVAVSGGADSVCLLHVLQQLAPIWQLALHVAHVDHGLRPDAAADADFVASLARALALPYHQTRIPPGTLDDDPRGVEAAARLARYAFLRAIAMQLGANVTIATAHHQDDQAETLLLHLIQGSGLQGLAGMAPVATLPDAAQPPLRLVRPLLEVSRADIQAYLQSCGQSWREDSSNRDLAHPRNRLRHQVLPLLATINPNIRATLARTAGLLAAEADHAAQRDRTALATMTQAHTPSTRLVLDWFQLAQADLATQRGVLRQAMLKLGIDLRTVGLDGIDRLLDQVRASAPGGPHPLMAGWAWTLLLVEPGIDSSTRQRHLALALHRADTLPITLQHPHFVAPVVPAMSIPRQGVLTHDLWQLHSELIAPDALPADWRRQPWHLFADAAACGDLYLTTFQAGMKIAPLGMGGRRRSLGDILTDRKVPSYLRGGWPVVVDDNGEVVWLCGLVIAERVRLHAHTRLVRHLYWQLETPAI